MSINIINFFVVTITFASTLFSETTFLLVRHGQTDWNKEEITQGWSDIPLNETGRIQARATAKQLFQNYPSISAIYSSDLSRAFETAQETGKLFNLGVRQRKDLRVLYLGISEGMPHDVKEALCKDRRREIKERYSSRKERWNHSPIEGEETLNSLSERCIKELTRIANECPDQTVAVFCHHGPITILMAEILDREASDVPSVKNGQIVIVSFDQGRFKLDI